MTRRPLALAIALALSASAALTACDSVSGASEQELIQRAKDFQDQGKYKSGILELKSALQKNPDNVEARQLLGQLYLKSRQGAEAEKELSHALKLGANREALLPQLGEALLLMGEEQRVLDEIQLGDQISAINRARILQVRGHALFKMGKLNESCELFEQARQAAGSIPQTYWGLAKCAVAKRDLPKARAWLDEANKLPDERAQTLLFIGDWELLNNNPKAALAAYDAALKIDPDNLEALQGRIVQNLAAGHIDAAKADIEHVEKLLPKTAPAYYLRALLTYQQKNYPATRDALQEVLKTMPGHLPSLLLSGSTAYELGNFELAESQLQRYLTRYPGQPFATRILAATQIKQNHPDQALETLLPLLTPDSRDAQALLLAGEARRAMKDFTRAAEWFARAAAIDPKNATLRTQMGLNFLSEGNVTQGMSELQSAAALAPNQHTADNMLALAYIEQKQYDKALAAIQEMERNLPRNPGVSVLRGQVYAGKGDLARAGSSFEAALAVDPNFFPAIDALAQLDQLAKRPDAARQRLEGVLAHDKTHLQAMLALAQLALRQNDRKTALNWLEKAANAHPSALEPRQQLVSFYLENQDYAKALAVANAAQQAHPNSPVALDLLGTAQLAAGEKENALSSTKRLAEKMPQSAAAQMKLAQAHLNLGHQNEARVALNRALTLQSDFQPAQEALTNLEIQSGRINEALRLARQIQAAQPKAAIGFLLEGNAQLAASKPAAAAQAYSQAFALDKHNTTLIKWHQASYLTDRSNQADNRLIEWLDAQPADFPVRAYLAQHYLNTGRVPQAIGQYETLLRYAPGNVLVLNNLAALYQQQNDPRALATAEQAYKLNPKSAATQDTLGWILVTQGQAKRGLQLIQSAVTQQPQIPTLRYHLAVALAKTGAKSQARTELEQLLQKSPAFPESTSAKALLQSL